MKQPVRILHLEDDPADAELVEATLAGAGIDCRYNGVLYPARISRPRWSGGAST